VNIDVNRDGGSGGELTRILVKRYHGILLFIFVPNQLGMHTNTFFSYLGCVQPRE